MSRRLSSGIGVLAAAAVAGLAFSPVFAPWALLLPVLAVVVGVGLVDGLALRVPALAAVRAPLALAVGAAAGGAAVLAPSDDPLPALLDGVRSGWLRTLESTFPARPEPELVAFVPLLVLVAAVLGTEWLRRGIAPLATVVPSAAVLVVAQLYSAATGAAAVLLACGYGAAVGTVLVAGRGVRRLRRAVVVLLPVALVAAGAAGVLAVVDPVGLPAYSWHDRVRLGTVPAGAVNPLAELGGRLARPDEVAFTVTTGAAVDRWTLVVLDGYDGAGWSSSASYRPLGAALAADPAVRTPTEPHTADVLTAPGLGAWLPSQPRTESVAGAAPAVDERTGVLLADGARDTAADYALTWRSPDIPAGALVDAGVDPDAPQLAVTDIPAGIAAEAAAVLRGAPASFPAALALERWFRDNYVLATGGDLPTGHGDAQLRYFLEESRRGTSEQFAAAYALIARAAGIPVRLAVGFRHPTGPHQGGRTVVRNRDAFAWPEVAVAGFGWVPLDPTGGAREQAEPPGSAAAAAEEARDRLPESGALTAPQVQPAGPPGVPAPPGDPGRVDPVLALAVPVAVLLAWLVAVPVTKRVRRAGRRRGAPADAVVGAWTETRDRLRDHGMAMRSGMTIRDVERTAGPLLDGSAAELGRLADCVDRALWSGSGVDRAVADDAWRAASAVDGALRRRPVPDRVRAALRIRTLTGSRR